MKKKCLEVECVKIFLDYIQTKFPPYARQQRTVICLLCQDFAPNQQNFPQKNERGYNPGPEPFSSINTFIFKSKISTGVMGGSRIL